MRSLVVHARFGVGLAGARSVVVVATVRVTERIVFPVGRRAGAVGGVR